MNYFVYILRHKKVLLSFLFLFILSLSFFIKDLRIDSSTKKFFIQNDPDYIFYKKTIKKFGSDNSFVIGIHDDNLFTYKKLVLIKDMIFEIKKLDNIERVDSLFNQKDFVYRNGELHSELFIDPYNIPKDEKKLLQVKKDALRNVLINKNLISDNGKLFIIKVTIPEKESSSFNVKMTQKIEVILDKYKKSFDDIKLFGSPYLSYKIYKYIVHDIVFTIPLAILVIFLVIFYNLRNIKLTFIPIITSLLSILATLGFMGLMNIPISLLTAVVPALVVLIGTTEDTYLISEYVEEVKKGEKDIILNISKKLSLPIILTSLTTIIGFISIYLNDIEILKEFAIVSSFAIFINFIITIIIVPIVLDKLKYEKQKYNKGISYDKLLSFIVKVFKEYHKRVYFISALVVLISIFFVPKIILDNNTLNYFKKSSEVRKLAEFFKAKTHGIQSFYIVVEAPKNKAFKKWKYLHELEKIENFIKSNKVKFNFTISIADNLAWINQEFHNGDKRYFRVPKDERTIAAYYSFLHRKDMKNYIDTKYRIAKIDVYHNIFSSNEFNKQLLILKKFIHKNISKDLKIYITGHNVLINKAADTISVGQIKSLGVTFLMIFIIIYLAFKRIRAGVVVLISNIIPLLVLFSIMGAFKIPLNVVTAVIATITYGIIVDDTIHTMMRYRYEHSHGVEKEKALIDTIYGEGKAIIITSISLMIGFLTLLFSEFVPVIQFAILSIIVILVALFSDLFLTPALIKNISIKKGFE